MVSQMDALLIHLGTGRWSILHFIAMAYSSVILVPHSLGGAFWAPRLDYSCHVPSGSAFTAFNLSILRGANTSSIFPSDSSTAKGKCEYWNNTPDGGKIEECVDFDFDNSTFSSTFTSEYNLACGRSYLQISFQSLYMFGALVGAPVNGYLTDRYGRKRIVILGYISYVMLGVTSAWLPFLSSILIVRFLLGFLHVMVSVTSYVLSMEVLVPKMRTLTSFGACNIWAVMMMLYGGLGYLIRDWRILQTVMSLPGLFVLPALWYIDESPRWLIVNGRTREAIQVLGKIARWHGVELPPEANIESLIEDEAALIQQSHQQSSMWVDIKSIVGEYLLYIRTPRLRTIALCIFFDYLILGMIYYGLSLSGANISDDPYLYMVLMGLMEIPAYSLTGFVVERFGRKPTASVSFLIASVVLLILAVILKVYNTTVVALAMIGKVAITGGYQTIMLFSSELFPTEVRSRGVSSSYIFSRIGSILSPFITDLMGSIYPWAPFVVFGLGALLAAAVTILLPETRGQTLPDTVADMEARLTEAHNGNRRNVMTRNS